ncbi:MAG: hypothetical protein HY508_01755 [Acidobacteria bacterium]|nr:hypothetical protein [Acidobacteriota bacterium]
MSPKFLSPIQTQLPLVRDVIVLFVVIAGLAALPPPAAALGKLEGTVVNGTTGQPVPNQKVQLLVGGAGMREASSNLTDSNGRFSLSTAGGEGGAFFLIQSVFQGVNYRARVEGSTPTRLVVYEAADALPGLRIRSARVVVEAVGARARVQEFFAIENASDPPRTFANSGGTFRFRVGKSAESPTAAVLGQMNMPIPVAIQDGASPGELYINHALQPGTTVVMVSYEADYGAGSVAVDSSVDYPIGRAELLVSPATLAVESPLFHEAGVDSSTGLKKYEASDFAGGTVLAARVSGEAGSAASEASEQEGEVRTEPNSATRSGILMTLCMLLVLLWALGVRTAKEWKSAEEHKPESTARKDVEKRLDALLKSIADLDDLRESGKVPEKAYWKERLELKAKVAAILRKIPPALAESYATRNVPR